MGLIERCPACDTDLIYKRNKFRHYSRVIGVDPDGSDGVLYWQCPDCGHRWHRWPEGTHWHLIASVYLNEGGAAR